MREHLRELVRKALEVQAEKYGYKSNRLNFSLAPPPRTELGDYATNAALLLAKQAGVEPVKVADEMRSALVGIREVFEEISVAGGGFLNFRLSSDFARQKLAEFYPAHSRNRRRETILVECSSPNIGKPLSIAHIRSTIIGDSLARIFRWLGYRVITDNHLGDWGLQAGILVAAYKLWGKKPIAKMTMQELLELYVRFNAEMRANDELAVKARAETVLLQQEDRKTFALWRAIQKKSIAEFNRLYKVLGVHFDHTLGESFYRKDFKKIVADAQSAGIAQGSEGAIVIPLKDDEPPLIIQKNDGGYLYGTFDLATIRWRAKRWKLSRIFYVVANEQTQYLDQVFRAAEKLGWIGKGEAVHIKFGLLRGEDLKRLSTRAGKILLLEDVINEAISRARKIVEEKNPALSEKEKADISRVIGIGALKYNDLSQNRQTDIIFDWDRMLDFAGNSAPYIQYTYARLRSILRKIKNQKSPPEADPPLAEKIKKVDLGLLMAPDEIELMKKVLQLPEAIEDAAKELAPNFVAHYLWELANLTNAFYEKYPVLKVEPELRAARLWLIAKTSDTIKTGLSLLGIQAPERV